MVVNGRGRAGRGEIGHLRNATTHRLLIGQANSRYTAPFWDKCKAAARILGREKYGPFTRRHHGRRCVRPSVHQSIAALCASRSTQLPIQLTKNQFTPYNRSTLVCPKAIYNWSSSKGYSTLPLQQLCAGPEAQNQVVNCFGFSCDGTYTLREESDWMRLRKEKDQLTLPSSSHCTAPHPKKVHPPIKTSTAKRVTLATCRCPVGSDVDGFPVPAGAPFMHEAGLSPCRTRLFIHSTNLTHPIHAATQDNVIPATAQCCQWVFLILVAAPAASVSAFHQPCHRQRVFLEGHDEVFMTRIFFNFESWDIVKLMRAHSQVADQRF